VQRKRVLAIKGRGATGACNPNIFDDMSGLLESHFGGSPPVSAGVARQRAFAGTCFAVSPDGFVLTNHHVVEDLSRFSVRFENGAEFKAEVWASNPLRDLALVRFDGPTPAYLSLANDSSVALGDEVFTLGYPASNVLGVNVKYGDGTVSALSGPGGEEGWLQVSVPVHPGSSGSPLVDGNGEVVGIIVGSIRAASFFRQTLSLPQDINFAIKAHYAKSLFDEPEPMPVPRDIIEHVRTAVCAVIPRR
jgi:S1-C subfamily serine protease